VIFLVREITSKFDINSLLICPPHLHAVATLPWEIKQVIFSNIIRMYFWLFLHYLRTKQSTTVTVHLNHLFHTPKIIKIG